MSNSKASFFISEGGTDFLFPKVEYKWCCQHNSSAGSNFSGKVNWFLTKSTINSSWMVCKNRSLQCWTNSCSRPANKLRPTGKSLFKAATIRLDEASLLLPPAPLALAFFFLAFPFPPPRPELSPKGPVSYFFADNFQVLPSQAKSSCQGKKVVIDVGVCSFNEAEG